MKKLIFRSQQAPGDIVMLTAAVRDLHRCFPGQFVTDVRTPCPGLWEHSPYLTRLDEEQPDVEVIDCQYPLIQRSNTQPWHFIFGFIEFLNERLGLHIQPTNFKGDIHFSIEEMRWMSQVHEITGEDTPFWVIVAGGKADGTTKWWSTERWQKVVDHFRGKILFVQVGDLEHHHPKLKGALDLRGKTNLRQLVRLVYHAQGVVCPVTSLMHLAAAVPAKRGMPKNRACVVVAGGREPPHWEAYPHHQFIHTNGQLLCCDNGGCWKSRTVPLGDGAEQDLPINLCTQPIELNPGKPKAGNGAALPNGTKNPGIENATRWLPRCMNMISADEVIRRVAGYFAGGALHYMKPEQWERTERARRRYNRYGTLGIKIETLAANGKHSHGTAEPPKGTEAEVAVWHRMQFEAAAARKPRYPSKRFRGRGIVICGGGMKYFPCAWVCINMLRRAGCTLPIELWHLGAAEMTPRMRSLVEPLGVQCVDAFETRKQHPVRILKGWELKCYAIIHSRFAELILLDADNVPLRDPAFLLDTPEFRNTGALFWPDLGRLSSDRSIWQICGVEYRDEAEFESGQIVIDKRRCWRALQLSMHMNEYSDFFYRHIHGDKETFHMAWRKLHQKFTLPSKRPQCIPGTLCQHDLNGNRLFQHRGKKWSINDRAPTLGFIYEAKCFELLDDLARRWPEARNIDPSAKIAASRKITPRLVLRAPIDASTLRLLRAPRAARVLHGFPRLAWPDGPRLNRKWHDKKSSGISPLSLYHSRLPTLMRRRKSKANFA